MAMPMFLISFSLKDRERDYRKFFDTLESLGSPLQALDSAWLLDAEKSSYQVVDALREQLGPEDLLLVTRMVRGYNGWLHKSVWRWLRERLQ